MADIIQAQIIDEEIVMPSADPVAHNMPGGGAVESVNGKTGAVVLTAEDLGAISQDDLQEATNEALAQAKASGEFDGAPGKDGADGQPGENGTDGYSPTANVTKNDNGATITISDKNGTTTATVTNGKDGANGKDGIDGKDGTSVTISSMSESTEDGGNNVVTFSDGKTLTVKNGKTGATGATGADGTSVTVSSVSESTADGGENIVTFSDGKSLTVKNGSKGDPTDVQQTTGQSTDAVMSQKAVTDEIDALKSDITDLQTALIGVSDLIGGDA